MKMAISITIAMTILILSLKSIIFVGLKQQHNNDNIKRIECGIPY